MIVRYSTFIFLLLCMQLLAGCSSDKVTRGLYEGIRVRNGLQSSPSERFGKQEVPVYPEYERMRKEQR